MPESGSTSIPKELVDKIPVIYHLAADFVTFKEIPLEFLVSSEEEKHWKVAIKDENDEPVLKIFTDKELFDFAVGYGFLNYLSYYLGQIETRALKSLWLLKDMVVDVTNSMQDPGNNELTSKLKFSTFQSIGFLKENKKVFEAEIKSE